MKLKNYQKIAISELKAKMALLAVQMQENQADMNIGQLSTTEDINNMDDCKFKHHDWVRLRIAFFPFVSSSLGYVEAIKRLQYVTPIGIFIREYYDIRGWNDGAKYKFPAWRLILDKQKILTAKLTGESTNISMEGSEKTAADSMGFAPSEPSDMIDAMRYAHKQIAGLTGIKTL